MDRIHAEIQAALFELQDMKYREFNSKLLPTIDPARIIGVRVPEVRKLAKKLRNDPDIDMFLNELPHRYFEENNLHAFLIEQIRDYDSCITVLNAFLPHVDNWATCDSLAPKALIQRPDQLLEQIERWLCSGETYMVRYGIGMLMRHFLDARFQSAYPERVSRIHSEEYYVNMMIAWYFATALAKQYDTVLPYLEEKRLSPWVHNKTIQKAVESFRITREQKAYLKTLRQPVHGVETA